jgi:hypothetical protein
MTATTRIDLELQKKGNDFRSDVLVPAFFNPFACQGLPTHWHSSGKPCSRDKSRN